ncbi:MAG: hypothetical protein QNK04_24010 [Myxococcota bacterium]|nr:hypothetical protein [Myxococcota bacterium]
MPIGERDVVRAAYTWNLVVEAARLGHSATLLAPSGASASPLWPDVGTGPVGAEVLLTAAEGLGDLNRAALDVAVTRAADASEGGLVVVRVPPAWLRDAPAGRALLRWVLLYSSPEKEDLRASYAIAKRILAGVTESRVGLTIHGARCIAEAERAFEHVADVALRHVGRPLVSYGLLVDDLHVYRAIVSRRPIGLEHPQSRAARALRDVTRLLLEDAEKTTLA